MHTRVHRHLLARLAQLRRRICLRTHSPPTYSPTRSVKNSICPKSHSRGSGLVTEVVLLLRATPFSRQTQSTAASHQSSYAFSYSPTRSVKNSICPNSHSRGSGLVTEVVLLLAGDDLYIESTWRTAFEFPTCQDVPEMRAIERLYLRGPRVHRFSTDPAQPHGA